MIQYTSMLFFIQNANNVISPHTFKWQKLQGKKPQQTQGVLNTNLVQSFTSSWSKIFYNGKRFS